jgi:hypothetical protein
MLLNGPSRSNQQRFSDQRFSGAIQICS